MLLRVLNVSKSYGIHTVLNSVSLSFAEGQRTGIVGANGVGKSTLLRIIAGALDPDSGAVEVYAGVRVGYLRQRLRVDEGQTVADLLDNALADLRGMEAHLRDLEARMTTASGDDLDVVMQTYGEITEQFERRGGYEIDARTGAVLDGLKVSSIAHERKLATLSGGEKARLSLAGLLLGAPDVLLLDEPTNHLDIASLHWLEAYLAAYRGGVLIVSHDRHFLNQTVNAVLEIDEHTHEGRRYTGDYDAYRAAKILEREHWARDYARQQEAIKALQTEVKVGAYSNRNYRTPSDGDKFIRNHKIAKHEATVAKRIRSAREQLARILDDPIPEPPDDLRFSATFDPRAFGARYPLRVENVSKAYDGQTVLESINFTLSADSRVVLVGPNGAGKSTLLRIVMGLEAPDSGTVNVSPAVRVGYLDQEQRLLDPTHTVFEAAHAGVAIDEQPLKAMLISLGLFNYDDLDKRVGDLSAGQQRKIQIARLIAGECNLLILDEPTNYVSFDVLEGLEAALRSFPGPVLATSHDRRFIENFAGAVWRLHDGVLQTTAVGGRI